jgi:hypothetical protein
VQDFESTDSDGLDTRYITWIARRAPVPALVFKSIHGCPSIVAATSVVGARGWLVKQDHPAYIPRTGCVRSARG